ncbi:MAG TPA: enoyl-CoA hydratase/isomerase family protein [Bryobacteraceae bacterium]
MSDTLHIESHGRVLRLMLDRPEKRNALSALLCRDLVEALENAGRDPAVGAILLSARGKSFCAGMDVSEFSGGGAPEGLGNLHERLFTAGARLPKPLIGSVQGAALGGGVGLVANCHIVIASEEATFGLTEIRLGLWPFLVFRVVAAALGERRAVELALTGRIIDAKAARELGLVHEISPDPDKAAMELAASVAEFSPTAIRRGLMFVEESRGKDWETAGVIARRVRAEVFESPDFQEGIRAFREKRRPQWPSLWGT